MSLNPALDLQAALYDALINHTGLSDALGGQYIYDDVPQQSQFPYVTFGEIDTRDWDTQTSTGHEHFVTLHIWSNHRGRKEVQEIIGQIDDVLDDASLVLEDHQLVNLHLTFWSAMRDLDGQAYHGIIRLRAVTE